MPSKGSRFTGPLEQTAVYWPRPTSDGVGGWTFEAGTEIDVRWSERREQFIDAEGRERISQAVVFVGQDVKAGGYLFLGDLDDLASGEEADPTTIEPDDTHDRAHEIRAYRKVPDRKAQAWERKAWL